MLQAAAKKDEPAAAEVGGQPSPVNQRKESTTESEVSATSNEEAELLVNH